MPLSSIFHQINQSKEPSFDKLREEMVQNQIVCRGIKDSKVLEAMRKVPRHLFIPTKDWNEAYEDHPIPIGEGQTISQPYIVAYMTEVLQLQKTNKVLEIGTGCGYQTAILAELTPHIYSIEYYAILAERAQNTLQKLGYTTVKIKQGDGYEGWQEYAPFDAIIGTCAPEQIPESLIAQLAEGGRMIIPVGDRFSQELYLIQKQNDNINPTSLLPVIFVPMLHN